MGKVESVMLIAVILLSGIVFALYIAYPEACRHWMEGRYSPVPGNDACWLSLCTREGLNINCIGFPLGYDDCGALEYACTGIVEHRNRFAPGSLTWHDELGYECVWGNQTCQCVKKGGGACEI